MTQLPQDAKTAVKDWKAKGGKVLLLVPEFNPGAGCANCHTVGRLSLEFIIGGPYVHPHSGIVKDQSGNAKEVHSATSINGKWYKRKIKCYTCPACKGIGISEEKGTQTRPPLKRLTARPIRETAEKMRATNGSISGRG